jgi:uncharacterized membrane protein
MRRQATLGRVVFITAFVAATIGLNELISALEDGDILRIGVWLSVVLVFIFITGFFIYSDERQRGRVKHTIGLYDRVIGWQRRGQQDERTGQQ